MFRERAPFLFINSMLRIRSCRPLHRNPSLTRLEPVPPVSQSRRVGEGSLTMAVPLISAVTNAAVPNLPPPIFPTNPH